MKTKGWIIVGLIIVLTAGVFFWHRSRLQAKEAAQSAVTTKVTTGPIEETVQANGEVTPLNRVEIKPPIAGRVEKLLVDEGDHVKAGDIIAWMSSSDRAAILDAARAQGPEAVKHWEDAYKPTPIVAPLSGVIILRNVVVGQTVDASIVLYAMADKLIVVADVDEADIARVKLKMPARITLDAYPDNVVNGKVFQILYEGKNVSNVITYGVKIDPEHAPPLFRSQMTANIDLIVSRKENALLLPSPAVRDVGNGEKRVMVPTPDGPPKAVTVETGIESGGQVEIVSGLQEGDEVVVSSRRYRPQQGPQSSPLMMGGRKNSNSGQGGGGQSGGRGGGGGGRS